LEKAVRNNGKHVNDNNYNNNYNNPIYVVPFAVFKALKMFKMNTLFAKMYGTTDY